MYSWQKEMAGEFPDGSTGPLGSRRNKPRRSGPLQPVPKGLARIPGTGWEDADAYAAKQHEIAELELAKNESILASYTPIAQRNETMSARPTNIGDTYRGIREHWQSRKDEPLLDKARRELEQWKSRGQQVATVMGPAGWVGGSAGIDAALRTGGQMIRGGLGEASRFPENYQEEIGKFGALGRWSDEMLEESMRRNERAGLGVGQQVALDMLTPLGPFRMGGTGARAARGLTGVADPLADVQVVGRGSVATGTGGMASPGDTSRVARAVNEYPDDWRIPEQVDLGVDTDMELAGGLAPQGGRVGGLYDEGAHVRSDVVPTADQRRNARRWQVQMEGLVTSARAAQETSIQAYMRTMRNEQTPEFFQAEVEELVTQLREAGDDEAAALIESGVTATEPREPWGRGSSPLERWSRENDAISGTGRFSAERPSDQLDDVLPAWRQAMDDLAELREHGWHVEDGVAVRTRDNYLDAAEQREIAAMGQGSQAENERLWREGRANEQTTSDVDVQRLLVEANDEALNVDAAERAAGGPLSNLAPEDLDDLLAATLEQGDMAAARGIGAHLGLREEDLVSMSGGADEATHAEETARRMAEVEGDLPTRDAEILFGEHAPVTAMVPELEGNLLRELGYEEVATLGNAVGALRGSGRGEEADELAAAFGYRDPYDRTWNTVELERVDEGTLAALSRTASNEASSARLRARVQELTREAQRLQDAPMGALDDIPEGLPHPSRDERGMLRELGYDQSEELGVRVGDMIRDGRVDDAFRLAREYGYEPVDGGLMFTGENVNEVTFRQAMQRHFNTDDPREAFARGGTDTHPATVRDRLEIYDRVSDDRWDAAVEYYNNAGAEISEGEWMWLEQLDPSVPNLEQRLETLRTSSRPEETAGRQSALDRPAPAEMTEAEMRRQQQEDLLRFFERNREQAAEDAATRERIRSRRDETTSMLPWLAGGLALGEEGEGEGGMAMAAAGALARPGRGRLLRTTGLEGLPSYARPATISYVPKRPPTSREQAAQDVADQAVEAKLPEARRRIEEGLASGHALPWFNLDPMVERVGGLLPEEKVGPWFEGFSARLGPTSSGSTVPMNVRRAMFAQHANEAGVPIETLDPSQNAPWAPAGHKRYYNAILPGLARIEEAQRAGQGALSALHPKGDFKIRRYGEAAHGNLMHGIPDMHETRFWFGHDQPSAPEQRAIDNVYRDVLSAEFGITPGQTMASRWVTSPDVKDPRGLIHHVNEQVALNADRMGITDQEFFERMVLGQLPVGARRMPQVKQVTKDYVVNIVSPYDFAKARDVAASKSDYGAFLSPTSGEQFLDSRTLTFLSSDGKVGYALDPSGDIQNLFNASKRRGHGRKAMEHALAQGGVKLDAYEGFLTELYGKRGFEITGRERWNPEYGPEDWNYERFGEPDVLYMRFHGEPADPADAVIRAPRKRKRKRKK